MHAFLHTMAVSVGCVLALAPALVPSARPARRWPHVVMALGMATGHLGGLFLSVTVLALLTAAWLCGSPSRRAETGQHIQDFVVMALLLVLTAISGPAPAGASFGHAHAHGGGSLTTVALVIGLAWTCARLIRVLTDWGTDRRALNQNACSAGMAASMAFMALLAL
ncbi:hypothetical protein [Nonomuraea guangzhouensis]|uniref:DUF5134 domain-containing protein n=1 Tax=Nonomuraea guangzhouensis TaxID=1291555 RepID=A0ABW4G0C0_9ACTN|nr:hypothetical protein [Nonomuraea guangzhouensis]